MLMPVSLRLQLLLQRLRGVLDDEGRLAQRLVGHAGDGGQGLVGAPTLANCLAEVGARPLSLPRLLGDRRLERQRQFGALEGRQVATPELVLDDPQLGRRAVGQRD